MIEIFNIKPSEKRKKFCIAVISALLNVVAEVLFF